MDAIQVSKRCFEQMKQGIPSNNCALLGATLIDAGVEAAGGWAAARLLLEGLMGQKGTVDFAQRMIGGEQTPTVDIAWDDPVDACRTFAYRQGSCGRMDQGVYALGVAFVSGPGVAVEAQGQVVVAKETSLLGALFQAASVAPRAVALLLEQGVDQGDIQWAWSSCPMVALSNDADCLRERQQRLHQKEAAISIWVRGEDEMLGDIARKSGYDQLRLNNLVSGKTHLSRQ